LRTAAHFGGEGGAAVDMSILRDAKDGAPLLPGSSLAGALRGNLADFLAGYRSEEHQDAALLFGGGRGDDLGSQSPLIIFDSLGRIPDGLSVEIRDGVALDPVTGTAEAHKKFDFEVLPAGTTFPLRLDLLIEAPERESSLLGLLVATLDGLTEGGISVGLRRSRGLGAITARNWKAKRYNLTESSGWIDWAVSDHLDPIGADARVHPCALEAIRSADSTVQPRNVTDKRRRLIAELHLRLSGDILVRSPATDAAAPDVTHLRSAGKPILPGTGAAGAFRAQALRISRLVREAKGDGKLWVDRLFGPRPEGDGENRAQNGEAFASKLRISESFINGGVGRRQTRIAVDRFTGGVVKSALFDEQIENGGTVEMRFELREPCDPEVGLFLLTLKDLLSGFIPVGGGASVGRGLFTGTAILRPPQGAEIPIESDLQLGDKALEYCNACIEAFHKAETLTETEVRS
jgi:CRISPR/Cas system CSM-associated protein Csm3 (group 7 of RAMP superfamily)